MELNKINKILDKQIFFNNAKTRVKRQIKNFLKYDLNKVDIIKIKTKYIKKIDYNNQELIYMDRNKEFYYIDINNFNNYGTLRLRKEFFYFPRNKNFCFVFINYCVIVDNLQDLQDLINHNQDIIFNVDDKERKKLINTQKRYKKYLTTHYNNVYIDEVENYNINVFYNKYENKKIDVNKEFNKDKKIMYINELIRLFKKDSTINTILTSQFTFSYTKAQTIKFLKCLGYDVNNKLSTKEILNTIILKSDLNKTSFLIKFKIR